MNFPGPYREIKRVVLSDSEGEEEEIRGFRPRREQIVKPYPERLGATES